MPVIKFGNYLDRKIPEKTIKILFFSELLQPFPTTVSVWVYCGGSDLTIKENKLAGQNWGCLGIGWLPRLSMYPYFKKKTYVRPFLWLLSLGLGLQEITIQLLWFILHFNILDDHEKHFRNYGHWNFHRSHWNLEELAVIRPANHGSPHDASSQLAVSKNHQTEALQVSNKITSSVAIFEDLWR